MEGFVGNYRKKLGKYEDVRMKFTGEFVRIGMKNGWRGVPEETVLIKNILDDKGNLLSDHLWFNRTKAFKEANPNSGDMVEFYGRVKRYMKGYMGWKEDVINEIGYDFKISYPTRVKVIKKNDN